MQDHNWRYNSAGLYACTKCQLQAELGTHDDLKGLCEGYELKWHMYGTGQSSLTWRCFYCGVEVTQQMIANRTECPCIHEKCICHMRHYGACPIKPQMSMDFGNSQKETCKCPIADLFSYGHVQGCPEAKPVKISKSRYTLKE